MKPSLSFALYAGAILLLAWLVSPALADSAAGYAKATRLLTAGKDFNQAIALLQSAVRAQPNNPDYHLALGCAYADRAASIGYADIWQKQYAADKASYPQQLASWKADQKKEPSPWPAPAQPPATFRAYTKDDGKPFLLTDAQAQVRIKQLNQAASREFAAAVSLSRSQKKKAKAEYTQGWAILVDGTFASAWTPQSGGKPGAKKALEDFQAATRDDPADAIYWESLGYFESDQDAVHAYQHATALQPDNAPLLYTLYTAYSQSFPFGDLLNALSKSGPVHGFAPGARPSQAKALVYVEKAISADPGNAYPLYELAGRQMQATRYINNRYNSADTYTPAQKNQADVQLSKSLTNQDIARARYALRLLEDGNKRPICGYPRFQPPVPAWLRVPWYYGGIVNAIGPVDQIPSNADLRGLARDVAGGWAEAAALKGDLPSAEKADRSVIAMGLKMMGAWPAKDSSPYDGEVIQTLAGSAIAEIGFGGLVQIDKQYGTRAQVARAEAEQAAFKKRFNSYRRVLKKNLPTTIYASY